VEVFQIFLRRSYEKICYLFCYYIAPCGNQRAKL
jgi:hypothetical protein